MDKRNKTMKTTYAVTPLVCFAVFSLLAVSSTSAEYWGGVADPPAAGKSGNADMSILDVKLPYLAPTIFYAYAYQGLTAPNQKHYLSFYAGAVHNDHGQPKSPTKTFYQCSFWGPPHTTSVDYVAPGFWHGDEPGEGASAQLGGTHVVEPGTWTRHVRRLWYPSDKNKAKEYTYMAWWINELDGDRQWRLLCVQTLELSKAKFVGAGLGGFIEDFGNGAINRIGQSVRNLYTRRSGQWSPCKFVTYANGEQRLLTVSDDETSVLYEFSARPFEGAQKATDQKTITLKQDPAPAMDPMKVVSLKAHKNGNNVLVSWKIDAMSTPQLRATVELFDNAMATGEPLHVVESDLPHIDNLFLEISPEQAARAIAIRITITDIFDRPQVKTCKIVKEAVSRAFTPKVITFPQTGQIKVSYHLLEGAKKQRNGEATFANWDKCPDTTDGLTLHSTTFQSNPRLHLIPRNYGLFVGERSYLHIEEKGLYRFHLRASPGGRMRMNGRVLIDQPLYGFNKTRSGWAVLNKGYYPVDMEIYLDHGGAAKVYLEYEGPGISRRKVPSDAWVLPASDMPPGRLDLVATMGTGDRSNWVEFKLSASTPPSQNAERIEVISSTGVKWCTLKGTKPSEHFMPEGTHELFVRSHEKGNLIVDGTPITVTVRNAPPEGWELPPNKGRRPLGSLLQEDRIILMGDGYHWARRKVKGDFVYQMRLKEFVNAVGNHVNSPDYAIGFVVTSAKNQPAPTTFTWWYDYYYKGRYSIPSKLVGPLQGANWSSSVHNVAIPGYIRFTRKEGVFKLETCFGKGKPWNIVFEGKVDLPETMLLGPFFRCTRGVDPKRFHRAEFDEITIQQ